MSSRIETLGCHFVDPLNMRPEDVRIDDIAYALSHQCRFNGYTSRHYSVAEHSVYVAEQVEARIVATYGKLSGYMDNPFVMADGTSTTVRRILRQALLHDATEAYLCDLPRPIKNAIPQYKEIEDRLWTVLAAVFDVPDEMHPWVKEADMRMCVSEKVVLLSPHGLDRPEWVTLNGAFPAYEPNPVPKDWQISPRMARKRFLDFYDRVK